MKIQPISKSAGFDHEAAERARQWVLNDYEYALAALPYVLHESVQNMIFDHTETIQKALDVALEPQVRAISKALGDDRWNRDTHGQFATVESRKKPIRYGPEPRPHRGKVARTPGKSAPGLSARDQNHYAAAYDQVADEIDAALQSGHDPLDTFWTTHWRDKQGRISSDRGVGLDPDAIAPPEKFADGKQLIEVGLTTKQPLNAAGAGYDLMSGMSNPRTAAAIGGGLGRFDSEFGDERLRYGDRLGAGKNTRGEAPPTKTTALFNRLRASSELATAVMGENAPGKMQLAAQVATFVGTHGPEAEKVLGPPTQRAAYRYRGVEKKPDPKLQATIDGSIKAATKQLEKDGLGQSVINSRAREAVLYGYEKQVGATPKRPGQPIKTEHAESGLITYFQERLPKPDLYRLQRGSGVLPPSQGVIIDRHGRVAHEAVGYGEDWYLPFNLKNLKALKGGEYVRTRAYGGLTTEDIYTGLVSGARSVTVVSNSGVFTLEFDDNFRGGRRLNDKAARMVSRYGSLLAAIQKGDIEVAGLDPSLRREIEMKAAKVYDPVDSPSQYKAMVERETSKASMTPRLSERQKDAIAEEVTADAAREYADRNEYHAEDLGDVVEHESQAIHARYANYVGKPLGPDNSLITAAQARQLAQAEIESKWGTPSIAAATLGVESKIERAEAAALREVEHNTSTLKLDGEGYEYAGKALEEQFPYYIGRFSARNLGRRYDAGYVKPGGLRPSTGPRPSGDGPRPSAPSLGDRLREGVAAGRQEQRAVDQVTTEQETPTVTRSAQMEERAAAVEAARQAQLHRAIGPMAEGTYGGKNMIEGRGASGPNAQEWLNEHFGFVLDPAFGAKYGRDPIFTARAKEQMAAAHKHQIFEGADFGPALGIKDTPLAEWNGVDALSGQPEDFDFGEEFTALAGGSDPSIAKDYYAKLLVQDPDIRRTAQREELDTDDPEQMATNIPVIRGRKVREMKNWLARENNHKTAFGAQKDKYPLPDPAEFDRLEEDLLGLDKAAVALKHHRAYSNLERAATPVPAGQQVIESNVLVVPSPEHAAQAAQRVEQNGREPFIGGPMSPEQVAIFRGAGGTTP